jgi:hypothetical protein
MRPPKVDQSHFFVSEERSPKLNKESFCNPTFFWLAFRCCRCSFYLSQLFPMLYFPCFYLRIRPAIMFSSNPWAPADIDLLSYDDFSLPPPVSAQSGSTPSPPSFYGMSSQQSGTGYQMFGYVCWPFTLPTLFRIEQRYSLTNNLF